MYNVTQLNATHTIDQFFQGFSSFNINNKSTPTYCIYSFHPLDGIIWRGSKQNKLHFNEDIIQFFCFVFLQMEAQSSIISSK